MKNLEQYFNRSTVKRNNYKKVFCISMKVLFCFSYLYPYHTFFSQLVLLWIIPFFFFLLLGIIIYSIFFIVIFLSFSFTPSFSILSFDFLLISDSHYHPGFLFLNMRFFSFHCHISFSYSFGVSLVLFDLVWYALLYFFFQCICPYFIFYVFGINFLLCKICIHSLFYLVNYIYFPS